MDSGCDHLAGRLRRAMWMMIVLALLLTTILGARALTITAPRTIDEGQPIAVSLSGTGSLAILRDGQTVASGGSRISDALLTNSSSAGLISYVFTDGTQNETRIVEVRDVPLALNVTSPGSDVISNDVAFGLNANWAPEFCYINIDSVSHSLGASTPTSFSGTFPIPDGVHAVEYKCKLGSEIATASRTLHVDAQPPVVGATSPAGDVTGPYVKLTVDTDEIASCRYSARDAEFSAMADSMGQTYATRNTVTLQLDSQGSYTYFVRCQDVYGNTMGSSSIISFLARIPPSASISVTGKEPLRSGTYALTLDTNVPLAAAPKLSYAFQEGGRQQQIALTGSDNRWNGYIIIPEEIGDTVISLSFEGVSREGVVGTRITSASLFTIDAMAPKAVDAIAVDNSSVHITLKWFTTQASDIASYNIYRADHEGVEYTDYYSSTSLTEFADHGAEGARYYYYRVAPLDAAGNIGPLSAEVYGSAVDQKLKNVELPAADPLLQARLDEEIAAMTAAMLDANGTVSALEREANPTNIQIIADMSLISEGRAAILQLETATGILKELRSRSPSKEQVDEGIVKSRTLLSEARHRLIARIVPQQQAETKQAADAAGLERSLPYVLVGQNLSAQDRSEYLAAATQLQDRITVTTTASSFTLYDIAGEAHPYTFVRKHVAPQDPANDVMLIETIPKSFAQDVGEIDFSTPPTVLRRDPVIMYSFPVLDQEEYAYSVQKIVSLDEVKTGRVFLYPKLPAVAPELAAQGAGGSLTGQVTRVAIPYLPSTDALLIVIGVLVIIALGAYYVSLSSKPFNGLPQQESGAGPGILSIARSRARPGMRSGARPAILPPAVPSAPMHGRPAAPAKVVSRPIPPVRAPVPAMSAPLMQSTRMTMPASSPGASAVAPASGAAAPGLAALGVAAPDIAVPGLAVPGLAARISAQSAASAAAASPAVTVFAADQQAPRSAPTSSDAVEESLRDAERSIDRKEYDCAISLYKEVASRVQKDEDLGRIMNVRMARVYAKLLLYRRMADAHGALQRQDAFALKQSLLEIRSVAAQVGEEDTTLIREAKSSYAALVQSLNALEIARVGRY